MAITATSQVFNTPELLELILLEIFKEAQPPSRRRGGGARTRNTMSYTTVELRKHILQRLLALQKVSRSFRSIIHSSTRLKEALYFRAVATPGTEDSHVNAMVYDTVLRLDEDAGF
jgi:hypothetical protein